MAGMLLRTRQKFRQDHRELILTVRICLFLCVPILFISIANVSEFVYKNEDSNVGVDLSEYHSRHLLAVEEPRNCTPPAILDFPPDGFTREQRQSGWIAGHCLISCYCFVLLAIVCDDYFVPAIEKMCAKLRMTEDVAGATFMAAASSSPELFINCVGTFITEGDLGVGTIVGSAVFNVLAVPACCGLLAGQVVDLDWWAISRDSMMYGIAVVSLIFTLQDDRVEWYEALILVTAYALYILAMYFNESMNKLAKGGCCKGKKSKGYTEVTPLLKKEHGSNQSIKADLAENGSVKVEDNNNDEIKREEQPEEEEEEEYSSIWEWPKKSTKWGKAFWVVTWPIGFILWLTIPNCKKYKKLFVLTFFMCIIWIGFTSYFVAWMITVIGDTINIPDSVMGLTFLAAGTSVPEAVASIIVTNQGHGAMGISNSIGSNTFDILLCLGLPWFIKSVFYPAVPGEYWVNINSSGLSYSAISLLSTLFGLYISFACNKFRLDWKIGLTCTGMYAGFLTLASLIELNYFFPVNLPTCDR